MAKSDWETDGTRNGYTVWCPVCAYGDCPYCDQCGICHVSDALEHCDDFDAYYESWDDYEISEGYREEPEEDENELIDELNSNERDYCIRYEPTYNEEDGSM